LFRVYIDLLMEYKKKFLVIGGMGSIGGRKVFDYILDKEIKIGATAPKEFYHLKTHQLKTVNTCWFTNLKYEHERPFLVLTKEYDKKDYFKFEQLDIINVDKLKDIPKDYD